MVSTRRSRSTAGDSEQLSPPGGSQNEVISSLKPSKQTVLEPISEEPAQRQQQQQQQGAAVDTPHGQQQQQQQHEEPQQPQSQRRRRVQQQQQQQSAPIASQPHAVAAAAADHAGGVVEDDGDDDDDWDFEGPGVLQNLAAAIRSAFHDQAGKQQATLPPVAAAAKQPSDADMDIGQLRWQPDTGLTLPPQAAAVTAAAGAAARSRQQQQPDDEPLGGPVVTAAADSHSTQEQIAATAAAAAAAAASKGPGLAKALTAPTLDAAARAKEARKSAPDTAGKKWFDLPAPKITDDVKRDLRLLRLRGAYDPKRFYKSFDNTKFPKYFAIGTVVDNPLDSASSRLPAGQRRASLTEQLLADTDLTNTRKKRYNKMQEEAQKWVKHKKRKTSQPRKTPSKHRPKH